MHIFIAVAVYDKLNTECAESILRNTHYLRDSGYKVMPYFHPGDCYIARARNVCVHLFLTTGCTDLIFVDSDLGFDSDAMLKLIKHDKDIVAGIYPYKRDNLSFPVNIYFDDAKQCMDIETGLMSVNIAPTGLMRIKRGVFERLIAEGAVKCDIDKIYSFFDTGMIFGDDIWYGDDVTFCKRWKSIGGEIFAEPRISFAHVGMKKYEGNYYDYITKQKTIFKMRAKNLSLESFIADLPIKDGVMAEIGCYTGESTEQFASSGKFLKIYAIDSWSNDISDPVAYLSDMKAVEGIFDVKTSNNGNIKKVKKSSIEASMDFPDNYFDFVYIDANHKYENVKDDILAWLPKVKDTGIIAGHDYHVFTGVTQAVDEIFGKPDKTFEDYSWMVEKEKKWQLLKR